MSLETLIVMAIKSSIALTVLGFALKATPSELTYLIRRPRRLVEALFAIDVVMPVFAVFLALAFDLHHAVKIALVALSVSPIPPLLPRKALLAGCSRAFTISLLATAAVLAIALVPLAMKLFERIFHVPLSMAPSTIAFIVFTSVLAPLIVGTIINGVAPDAARSLAKAASVTGPLLLAAAAIPLVVKAWPAMVSLIGDGTLVAIALFVAVGLFAGHRLGGPVSEDRTVLALSTASRHPAVALAIAQANFPEERSAMAAVLLYLLMSAVIAAPYLKWSSSGHPRPRGGHHEMDTSAA